MKLNKTFLMVAALLAAGPATAYEYSMSIEPWQKTTNFDYAIDSSEGFAMYGNPTSELIYEDMKSNGISVGFHGETGNDYFDAVFSYGKGSGTGSMIDNDYYSSSYAGAGNPTRFSSTLSDADIDDSWSINVAIGSIYQLPVNPLVDYGSLGLSIGLSQQSFAAKGLVVLEDPYSIYSGLGNPLFPQHESVIEHKISRFDIGLDTGLDKQLTDKISINMDTTFILASVVQSEDIHLKRNDLGSPSIVLTSVNYGIDTSLSLSYDFNDSFALYTGINYTFLAPYTDGKAEFFDSNNDSMGEVYLTRHNMDSLRFYAGLQYKF